ncbi:hypothetical protein B0H10DRAFT_2097931 [Mycena sp. CBHHK59/15]|nr:hypothetical protein B0H10DRAFT_2097931 [Mycena sp. CBHHK59/15]
MRLHICSVLALPLLAFASQADQVPMDAGPIPQTAFQPTLADLLTIEPSTSIFYSYARELASSDMFANTRGGPITLLVPTNKAVMALARKPHQDPEPIDTGVIVTEEEFDARSRANVERWVSAHIIPQSPITLDAETTYPTLLDGKSITFAPTSNGKADAPAWSRVVIDGRVHITAMHEASNGVLFLIDGTILLD